MIATVSRSLVWQETCRGPGSAIRYERRDVGESASRGSACAVGRSRAPAGGSTIIAVTGLTLTWPVAPGCCGRAAPPGGYSHGCMESKRRSTGAVSRLSFQVSAGKRRDTDRVDGGPSHESPARLGVILRPPGFGPGAFRLPKAPRRGIMRQFCLQMSVLWTHPMVSAGAALSLQVSNRASRTPDRCALASGLSLSRRPPRARNLGRERVL